MVMPIVMQTDEMTGDLWKHSDSVIEALDNPGIQQTTMKDGVCRLMVSFASSSFPAFVLPNHPGWLGVRKHCRHSKTHGICWFKSAHTNLKPSRKISPELNPFFSSYSPPQTRHRLQRPERTQSPPRKLPSCGRIEAL